MKNMFKLGISSKVIALATAIVFGGLAIGDAAARGEASAGGAASKSISTATAEVVGWRGDWTGSYPNANPVTEWGYWPKSPNHGLKYQVAKPGKDDDGRNATAITSRELPEWLIVGPFEPKDAAKALDEEFLPNEGLLAPAESDKAGDLAWQKRQVGTKSDIMPSSLAFQTITGKTGIAYGHVYPR